MYTRFSTEFPAMKGWHGVHLAAAPDQPLSFLQLCLSDQVCLHSEISDLR